MSTAGATMPGHHGRSTACVSFGDHAVIIDTRFGDDGPIPTLGHRHHHRCGRLDAPTVNRMATSASTLFADGLTAGVPLCDALGTCRATSVAHRAGHHGPGRSS